ncbi:serine hydrolase [Cuspidothrix issatschenkoi]|nr:serine hydrolase [Cuspidothrix issatschenkoi]
MNNNNKTHKIIRKINTSVLIRRIIFLFLLPISLFVVVFNKFTQNKAPTKIVDINQQKCQVISPLILTSDIQNLHKKNTANDKTACFSFEGQTGKIINFYSDTKIILKTPANKETSFYGKYKLILPESGNYLIIVPPYNDNNANTKISVSSKNQDINTIKPLQPVPTPSVSIEALMPTSQNEMRLIQPDEYNLQNIENKYATLVYNTKPPEFKSSENLDKIVNDIVSYVENKGLPSDKLSVSLLEINQPKFPYYAGYLPKEPRFAASIVKLFWMVYLYGNYNTNKLQRGIISEKDLKKMIQDSDNESSSVIVDKITGTESGESLSGEELKEWLQRRLAMNLFFKNAGYDPINVSQKVFPTSYQKNDAPVGRDLQLRDNEINPIRNYTNSYHITRLLYEIYMEKSISKKYSREMKKLMKRDLSPVAWKNKEFNAIEGFLGEKLPQNIKFYSKMGWNFKTRNDAAIIVSPDEKSKYILVVLGDDPSFYKDKTLFPEISRMVYDRMTDKANKTSN